MEVLEAIKTRRSIRRYRPEHVDEDKINAVIEAARWAPSWGNTQCWKFIVVKGEAVKSQLAETLASWNPVRSTSAIKQAPVVIVACAELGKSGFKEGVPSTNKGDWYMFDTALAMQNLVLAAHSLGLGTVHVGAFDAQEVARILEVPQGTVVVEMTPLGYPEREGKAPPRKELSEIVSYEIYR
ncbi:MAG: nitroreductase family protein [Chloroflexota bacterium]|nr:nitroreductase family protein [Chloroflexota bacterium]